MKIIAFLLVFVAIARAKFLEDGKEYVFQTESSASSGTMDYAPSTAGFSYKYKTKIQVSGNKLNVQISDITFSQFVGGSNPNEWPYDKTSFVNVNDQAPAFSVVLDNDGKFSSLVVPNGVPNFQLNLIKSWAQKLQLNVGQIKAGETGFTSPEQTLHGKCNVKYIVTSDKIMRAVSEMQDCEDRTFRQIDDWRGFRCDLIPGSSKRNSQEGLYSTTNTAFIGKMNGDYFDLKAIASSGAVVAQFYESEGVSHFAFTNSTSLLESSGSSSGDISPSGQTITDLKFVWEDEDYKWNKERDLKAKEPFFATGEYFDDDQNTIKAVIKQGLAIQKEILENHSHEKDAIVKAHKYGINTILPPLYALDYNTLKGLSEELMGDTSEDGIMKANLFNELLSSTGTTASALVVRDLILGNKFPNTRDATRVLTAVPFHIRRPNVQLLNEFEKLLNFNGERSVKMAIPLSFAHLVRITCERAGVMGSAPVMECFNTIGKKYVDKFYSQFESASDHEGRSLALSAIMNIRFGGIADKLKPLIYGETSVTCQRLRASAIWAASWDALMSGKGLDYFLPIFSDQSLDHELRLYALMMVMYSRPTPTDMNAIMLTLYTEKDYEVINYAFTLLERYANSIDPCDGRTQESAKYILKYLKQWSKYETDWGFGVSKTYTRQFQQKKYGYGGAYEFYTIGSHQSTTPLIIGMGISNTLFHSYQNYMFGIHLRIEGLAKGLIRKFKTIDPATWKTEDLKQIFDQMGVMTRKDQKVHVEVMIMLKGSIVIHRHYDENSVKEGGKIKDFIDTLKSLEDTYSINHQRVFQVGSFLYEQPTELGVPMSYMNSLTTMADIKAKVKKGNHRGLLFRDVKYDLHLFTQSANIMMVKNPNKKTSYGIVHDRIYHAHFPRSFVIGVNPVKKELKFSVKRPSYEKPLMFMMHSYNYVVARSNNIKGDLPELKQNCPTCENRVVVSRGPDALKTRDFIDATNDNVGFYVHGEYFDCERDISRGNTIKHAVQAFMPYNKNPKTAWTSVMMGIRQVRAFFIYYPLAEQCGAMLRWSQAKQNPVNEIEVSVRFNFEQNGERLFFRGRKWYIKALIKAKGQPADRQYRVNLAYEFTPGYLENNFKLQIQRAAVPGLMSDYSICASYENKYPDFSDEFLGYDKNSQLEVTGKARLRYGHTADCDSADGEIKATFKHSTTQESRDNLDNTWYYKKCMEQKNTNAWSGRGDRVPVTEACYMTVWDATTARKYHLNVDFVKQTDRMKGIISQVQSVIKAGLLPYWDMDPEDMPVSNTEPHMTLDFQLKNNDKNWDLKVETSQGVSQFEDVPFNFNWYNRLRNLKFTKTIKRLMDMKILSPCITTSETVRTMDNVTYAYTPSSCWTLTSGHCSPTPTYAVFSKKSSGLPLAVKAYFGGHLVEFTPQGPKKVEVKIDGAVQTIGEKEQVHKENGQELFKIFRWGSTYNVYSFLKVWVVYDGHFVEVIPAPSVKGQHCGLCGNFNRNKKDEFTAKDESLVSDANAMVNEWKWKC